jgi:hypothetical protein
MNFLHIVERDIFPAGESRRAIPMTAIRSVYETRHEDKSTTYRIDIGGRDRIETRHEPTVTELIEARDLEIWSFEVEPELVWSRAPLLVLPVERGIFTGELEASFDAVVGMLANSRSVNPMQAVLVDRRSRLATNLDHADWSHDLDAVCRFVIARAGYSTLVYSPPWLADLDKPVEELAAGRKAV